MQGKKKTHEDYLSELFDKDIFDIPLENYKGDGVAIQHECVNGHITSRIPNKVLKGQKCSRCSGNGKKKGNSEYLEDIERLKIPYIPIEDYKDTHTAIFHSCDCGHEWKAMPSNILRGQGCPKCAHNKHPGGYNFTRFEKNRKLAESPGMLYCIVLVNKISLERECVKVGITKGTSNKDVLKRATGFNGYEPRIQKIFSGTLEEVFTIEQKLHEKFSKHRYTESHKFGGHTELFELSALKDILHDFPKN